MWQEFYIACALVLVIEGILPALNPRAFKRTMRMVTELDERMIRIWGLSIMAIGAVLVFVLKS